MAEYTISVRMMQQDDTDPLMHTVEPSLILGHEEQFKGYFLQCFEQNKTKERVTFLAFMDHEIAGYVHLLFKSLYPYFLEKNIPEINDLYVNPAYRKQGIGKMLIDACEEYATGTYEYIGLGVGLYKDYGSAQRLYTKNGYILDGNGLMYGNVPVQPGRDVFVDDELLIYLYKKLP